MVNKVKDWIIKKDHQFVAAGYYEKPAHVIKLAQRISDNELFFLFMPYDTIDPLKSFYVTNFCDDMIRIDFEIQGNSEINTGTCEINDIIMSSNKRVIEISNFTLLGR